MIGLGVVRSPSDPVQKKGILAFSLLGTFSLPGTTGRPLSRAVVLEGYL